MDYFEIGSHNKFLSPLYYVVDSRQRIYWVYLLTSLVIAAIVYLLQRRTEAAGGEEDQGLLEFLVPREIFAHRSARADYVYFVTNAILYSFILAPFFFLYAAISSNTYMAFSNTFGHPAPEREATLLTTAAYTLCVALAFDFALFIAHYMAHRYPLLWQFHKVHHSAQVLTPLTVYRMHPLDDIFTISFTAVIGGAVDGAFRYLFMPNVQQSTVFGLNVVLFVFYIVGYHLRHSHVWLSYGHKLSNVLISPAQHQIHHSKAEQHWDTNFGFMFAFWDKAFGTLYIPKHREKIEFGIGEEEAQYSSVWQLYFTPFKNAYAVICEWFSRPRRR